LLFGDSQTKLGDSGLVNGAAADGNTQFQYFGGKSLFFNEGVATRMTLNATGLGVGEAASVSRLQARGSTTDSSAYILYGKASSGNVICFMRNDGRFLVGNGTTDNLIVTETGNVGISVTPSAWVTFKGLQVGTASLAGYDGGSDTLIGANVYYDGAFKYIAANIASSYRQLNGVHQWNTAVTGSVGALINGTGNFTQAMTLDASGNLLVGKTSASVPTVGFQSLSNGETSSTMASSTSAASTLNVYSTGATAYRFYVALNGTISATNTTISAISDARLKENVQDIDVGLGAILALKPRKFDWKEGKGKDIKGDRGFIAQEFEQVFPQLVDEWKDAAPEGEAPYKSVRQDLIPVLVKAIQELTARVQTLEAK
jgi:hypothetical protein